MPELPESDAARRKIADHCLNRTIEGFTLGEVSHVELPSEAEREQLVETQFSATRRHGKYIFAGRKGGPWLHVHLGMSGSFRIYDEGEDAPDYARLTVEFEGGRRLAFRDPRKFGAVALVPDVDDFIAGKGLGPDAMTIGDNAFASAIGATRGAIKSALLNQRKLAGVGNLWSDETLYRCGIMPDVRACDLDTGAVGQLHRTMQDIMGVVIEQNADYSQLPRDWLIHNRTDGADCPRCGGTITKKTVGGRTAYHCPDHQEGA
jgi:formamidopyrimidine-DNA glycosylase